MNIFKKVDSALLTEDAGTRQLGPELWEAHVVFVRDGAHAYAIIGSAYTESGAIQHLAMQMSIVKEWTEVTFHGAFWQSHRKEQKDQLEEAKAAIRERLGSTFGILEAGKKNEPDGEPS